MTATLTVAIRGPLNIDGTALRCPGRDRAPAPFRLSLMVSGSDVMASCGQKHRGADGGRKASCFFAVEQLTPAMVRLIADKAQPNRSFRVTLPGGKVIEGKRGPAAQPAPAGKGGTAAGAFAAKKAAARGGKAAPARRSGGGTLAAAFNAVTAVAGTATAAANAVGAGANAVGKGFDMGREGFRTGQAAIKAVDSAGARRFARDNASSGGDDGDGQADGE
ncbi:hypothetical protein [Streptomyces xanthii]|uniref:Uncharacterized protein n=1 Tax=Streptomyces xanthii TaxID=2768069 RepID=A0A7H1BL12_9ACTN|nr:hypothetical protein [Streptomyces xanthii]QNS09417.1 hypothetical protein IAG42_37260 [Streptomyces xanthii]